MYDPRHFADVEALVKHILETDPEARQNEKYLLQQYLKKTTNEDIAPDLLDYIYKIAVKLITIRRRREELQKKYPHLAHWQEARLVWNIDNF